MMNSQKNLSVFSTSAQCILTNPPILFVGSNHDSPLVRSDSTCYKID